MGADREPGATTTYRTPPSSSVLTAIRAEATDASAGAGPASDVPAEGASETEAVGSAGVEAVGSVGSEVTEPVCHQPTLPQIPSLIHQRVLTSRRPFTDPSSPHVA